MTASLRRCALGLVCLLFACASASADSLVLKDGTTLEGRVIEQGDQYWIKLADGTTRLIPKANVKTHTRGDAPPPAAQPPAAGAPAATRPGGAARSDLFLSTKRRADASESTGIAIGVWRKFVATNPPQADLEGATAELANWQRMAAEGAVKMQSKWVTGDDLKALQAKVKTLLTEADDLFRRNSTIQALRKLEEAQKAFPNYLPVTFMLGAIALRTNKVDDSIRYFEQVIRLYPDEPLAYNNLGVAYWDKGDQVQAMLMFQKSAEIHDDSGIAHNMVKAGAGLAAAQARNAKLKGAIDAAHLLAAKYSIDTRKDWEREPFLIAFAPSRAYNGGPRRGGGEDGLERFMASGTGFIISDDGLIVTNRHVVDKAQTVTVLVGGVERPGKVIVVDKEQDLALVKVEMPAGKTLPFLSFAVPDAPNEGALCFVMGYPLIDQVGASIKITQGIVSGRPPAGTGADVLTDAKVNPGNSGGPMLDKHGNVIGVVTLKSHGGDGQDSYGIAISAGNVRRFLAKNNVKAPAPAGPNPLNPLNAEEVAAKSKPATVCILVTGKQ